MAGDGVRGGGEGGGAWAGQSSVFSIYPETQTFWDYQDSKHSGRKHHYMTFAWLDYPIGKFVN